MKKVCLAVLFLLCANLAFAEVSLKLKDGRILTWQSYFEEGASYCTWKASGKFCISQDDVKVIKETGGDSGHASSGRSSGSSGNDNSDRTYRSSGSTSTIIQRRGSAVITDEGLSKEERDAEKERLDREQDLRRWEREKRLEKEKEEAKDRDEQLKREEAERQYQEERNRRIRRDEERMYRGTRNDGYRDTSRDVIR